MCEVLASEAPEQQREDRHPHEQGQLKSQQISSQKCVNGRAGGAPRSMGTLVVNEIVASETPERCRSTFLEHVCFLANKRLDYNDFVFH